MTNMYQRAIIEGSVATNVLSSTTKRGLGKVQSNDPKFREGAGWTNDEDTQFTLLTGSAGTNGLEVGQIAFQVTTLYPKTDKNKARQVKGTSVIGVNASAMDNSMINNLIRTNIPDVNDPIKGPVAINNVDAGYQMKVAKLPFVDISKHIPGLDNSKGFAYNMNILRTELKKGDPYDLSTGGVRIKITKVGDNTIKGMILNPDGTPFYDLSTMTKSDKELMKLDKFKALRGEEEVGWNTFSSFMGSEFFK